MADDQTSQQTRVLLVNGQTIILQGDAGDNSINEINADLIQQALQEVSAPTEDPLEDPIDEYNAPIAETEEVGDPNDNLVAIFQGDQGETHTIQLTVEQAEALGFHFSMDNEEKPVQSDMSDHAADNGVYITDEPNNRLVYSEDDKPNSDEVMFENDLGSSASCTDVVQSSSTTEDNEHVLESSRENIGVLSSSVDTFINDQSQATPLTLIPHYIDGQVTYTVKIQDGQNDGSLLQDSQFSSIDNELKSEPSEETLQQKNVRVNLNNISNFTNTCLSSVSASTNASLSSIGSLPMTVSSIQQPVSISSVSSGQQSVPLSITPVQQSVTLSIPTVQTVSLPNSSLQQTLSLNSYHSSKISGSSISLDKQTKTSYVILPGSNTSASSVTTKLSNTPLGRLSSSFVSSNRNQSLLNSNNLSSVLKSTPTLLSTSNSSNTTHVVTANNSTLTGIPLLSSNTTAVSSTSISASTGTSTSTADGMIRVVAGNATSRTIHQPFINNTSKFTNIPTPTSGKPLSTSAPTPKIVSINPSSANKVPTTATPEVTNMVSAALTRMPVPNFNSTKPLGSSENPIQLVQHGQTFHSVQSLSQDQLRQIATVLQQQHLEAAPRTKNVVYDAETNTRIIYRVVYPEDLDLRDPRSPDSRGSGLNTSLASGSGRGRGRRGRPPKSNLKGLGRGTDGSSSRRPGVGSGSVDMDFDEDRLILDDTAKGERKKQLARTRSGRLSRPPRHMVKDYKRLHHLDFADADLDDSDGGYSDYQMSEHETEEPTEKTNDKELLPGLAVPKRKISSHFRCPTCQKIYLGYSRMSRHLEMYPDHGNIDQLQVPKNNSNNNNNEDDRQSTTLESSMSTKVPLTVPSTGLNGIMRNAPSRRRGKRRGPWAYTTPEARSQRRKLKLREVLATCEANELAEVAGPAVAGVLSLWDLLLLRVESVRTEESYVVTLFDELQALLEKVRAIANDILKPLDETTNNKEHQLELQDELLCTTLGVASGTYLVDDSKLQQTNIISHEQVDEPSEKKTRIEARDDDEVENSSTNNGSNAVRNDVEECNTHRVEETDNSVNNRDQNCPEVLSALTLVARSSLKQECKDLSSLTSNGDEEDGASKVINNLVTKRNDFLLSSESNDMCPKLSDRSTDSSGERLEQSEHASEFPNSEHHSQELESVDDIVNERLKNLTSGSTLVDFSVSTPLNVMSGCMTTSSINIPKSSIVSSQDLIDRLGQFRSLQLPNDLTSSEVSSFDPEMALAAMGEGEQDSVSASSQHFQSSLQQMETMPGDSGSSFDPEVALAAMGEGEQSSTIEHPQNQFQQIENVPDGSTFTPEDALAAMGEGEQNSVQDETHRQFQNSLPQMNSISSDTRQAFDPEIALAAMGEGDQVTDNGSSEVGNTFQSTLQHIRIEDMTGNSGSFDPEEALAAMGEGTGSTVTEVQSQFSSAQRTHSNTGHSYSTAMDLDISANKTISNKSSTQCIDSVRDVSRFDPEMALAAMGEGETITVGDSSHIPYHSPISQSNQSSEPNSTFDPEMALAAIEQESVQSSATSQRLHADVPIVNSGSFQLQCAPDLGLADTSMDVSLDESGPDLDFEALSEEFSRNTRHR